MGHNLKHQTSHNFTAILANLVLHLTALDQGIADQHDLLCPAQSHQLHLLTSLLCRINDLQLLQHVNLDLGPVQVWQVTRHVLVIWLGCVLSVHLSPCLSHYCLQTPARTSFPAPNPLAQSPSPASFFSLNFLFFRTFCTNIKPNTRRRHGNQAKLLPPAKQMTKVTQQPKKVTVQSPNFKANS